MFCIWTFDKGVVCRNFVSTITTAYVQPEDITQKVMANILAISSLVYFVPVNNMSRTNVIAIAAVANGDV